MTRLEFQSPTLGMVGSTGYSSQLGGSSPVAGCRCSGITDIKRTFSSLFLDNRLPPFTEEEEEAATALVVTELLPPPPFVMKVARLLLLLLLLEERRERTPPETEGGGGRLLLGAEGEANG